MNSSSTELKAIASEYYTNAKMYYPEEFEDDFKFFDLFRRQIRKNTRAGKEANNLLALNHLVRLNNTFHPKGIMKVLTLMVEAEEVKDCNSFFLFLNMIPESVEEVNINPKILRELLEALR